MRNFVVKELNYCEILNQDSIKQIFDNFERELTSTEWEYPKSSP